MRRITTRTLIERHDDIRTECLLDFHDGFRREEVFRSISMRTKMHSLFSDFYERFFTAIRIFREIFLLHLAPEREYLESSTICEDRKRMSHESMESTEFSDHLMTGLEVCMIGIHKRYLSTRREELLSCESLHRCLRPDRHECGSMDHSMWCFDNPSTSESFSFFDSEGKWFFIHNFSDFSGV